MSAWIVRRMIWTKTMMDEVEKEDYCNTGKEEEVASNGEREGYNG